MDVGEKPKWLIVLLLKINKRKEKYEKYKKP